MSMYFGSVRFYKHIFLIAAAILITVPTILCVVLGVENHHYRQALGIEGSGTTVTDWGPAADPEPDPTLQEEGPDYHALYPALYANSEGRSTLREEKSVFLTFDDGPSARTREVLEVLNEAEVKATFFVDGKEDQESMTLMREIAEAGHTIGIHSYSHDYKEIYASVEAYLADFDRLYRLIYDVTGTYPQIFRFPGGSVNGYNGAVYQEIIAEMTRRGFVYFDWNVAADDAAPVPAEAGALAEQVISAVTETERAIVKLHDSEGRRTTAQALPAIIEGCRAKGYSFAPLTPEVVPIVFAYRE